MKRFTILAAVLAVALAACASEEPLMTVPPDPTTSAPAPDGVPPDTAGTVPSDTAGTGTEPDNPDGQVGLFASYLLSIDSCPAFLERLQEEALEHVGPWGFEDGGFGRGGFILEDGVATTTMSAMSDDAGVAESAPAPASAPPRAPEAGVDFSTTNIQEAGVDEPDIVKTDGNRILAVGGGRLWYVDVTGEKPELRSSLWLPEGWVREIFMSGDVVLMLLSGTGGDYDGMAALIDISDPGRMAIVETLQVSGSYVSARLVGERATVVFSYYPRPLPGFVYPASDAEESRRRAEEINRQAVLETTLADWVPSYRLEQGGTVSEGMFADCSSSFVPLSFSGRDLVSVLTVDVTDSLDPGAVTTVMSGAQNIYASSSNLYVTTQRWVDWWGIPEEARRSERDKYATHIHKFDITGPGRAQYAASGKVNGFLLNQFSLSEHEGYLRVASTNQPTWFGEEGKSESRVDVLAHEEDRLITVGSVSGLGRGEQIFAVRFLGDIGYVVTFRQTDPLYTIDLSDPSNPRTAGELKILGYSAYLHPMGEGLLLGVGQDADEQGVVSGLQVSVFDVSDLDNPRRTAQLTMRDAFSEAEFDHRAFLYWAPRDLVVLPLQYWIWEDNGNIKDSFLGAVALEVSRERVRRLELLRGHDSIRRTGFGQADSSQADVIEPWGEWTPMRRSLVVGDALFTLSDSGLAGYDLDALRETSWLGF